MTASDQTVSTEPILETEGLTKKFGEFVAVDNISLFIKKGEIYSIIGPNGAGKTTTFNMLTGALKPTSGTITYQGQQIESQSEHERAQSGIVRAFQMAQLFPELSILENVRLAAQSRNQSINPLRELDETSQTKAKEILSDLNLNTPITTKAKHMSHGDKKKLEIAMCVVTDPEVLLLDEPTSGVSNAESEWIIEYIEDLSEKMTIILIEHDLHMVLQLSDEITVLTRGEVLANGTPDEITSNEEVQEAYMGGE